MEGSDPVGAATIGEIASVVVLVRAEQLLVLAVLGVDEVSRFGVVKRWTGVLEEVRAAGPGYERADGRKADEGDVPDVLGDLEAAQFVEGEHETEFLVRPDVHPVRRNLKL